MTINRDITSHHLFWEINDVCSEITNNIKIPNLNINLNIKNMFDKINKNNIYDNEDKLKIILSYIKNNKKIIETEILHIATDFYNCLSEKYKNYNFAFSFMIDSDTYTVNLDSISGNIVEN